MAKKISELPAAIAPADGDLFPVVQAGSTKKQTFLALKSAVYAGLNLESLGVLRLLAGRNPGDTVRVQSFASGWAVNPLYPFPSGGGIFLWDSASVETIVSGMTEKVSGIDVGRWKRQYSGAVDVTWFGAIPDGVTKCSAAFQRAVDNYAAVYVPPGAFVLENYATHSLIYTPTLINCGIKITSAQKCKELYGAGDATTLLSEPGVRYNALISQYNVTDVSIHSFRMDGLYDRSGSAFLGALIGIRQQSIRRCRTFSITASHFAYHCLAMYGGSDSVTEPACLWNTAYDLYLDDGGQSSFLLYSSTFTGLVLPNEFNEFTDIHAMNSHVYFGVEIRKSNNNQFTNLVTNSNGKGGVNLEEGASNNKIKGLESKFNMYGLHLTGNGIANVTGNRISDFDISENISHNVLAFQGAVGNTLTRGKINSSGANGWRSEDTSSTGNQLIDVDVKDNIGEGLLFQAAENLTDVRITGNGLRGVTVFGAAKLRRVVSRGNGTNITTAAGVFADIKDCDFGPKHSILTKDGISVGNFVGVGQSGVYAGGGVSPAEVSEPGSQSTLVWKNTDSQGKFISIPTGIFAGSGFSTLKVSFRVKTDGASRLLRDISGATNITIPANTDWIWVTYNIAVSGLTASSVLNIRYESATGVGFALMDGYQLSLIQNDITDKRAFTAYTPTVTASSGTYTTKSATGSYMVAFGICHFEFAVTITTKGTGATAVVTLPFAARAGWGGRVFPCREGAATRKVGVAVMDVGLAQVFLTAYDNTDIITGDGCVVYCNGSYPIA
jgi:hypothetical protein